VTAKRFLPFLAAVVFATGGLTNAAIISQTQNFSGIISVNSASLNFNQFNLTLGTLQSIDILFYLQANGGAMILDNDSNLPASGVFQFGVTGSLFPTTDVELFNSSYQSVIGWIGSYHSQAFTLGADNGDGPHTYDPCAPDGLLYYGTTDSNSASGFVGDVFWPHGIKGFLGTGTYDIKYSITQLTDIGSIGGIQYAVNPAIASGYVTVTYNYDPVPEPATITLFTVGAFALLKRKSKK